MTRVVRGAALLAVLLGVVLRVSPAGADDASAGALDAGALDAEALASEVIEMVEERGPEDILAEQRALSVVDAAALERLAPRTTAEALLLLPGVSVQKTNHAGGSPIVRGLTGQKVLLMVDGFRLSNAIMRPGPSQYLVTVDPDVVGGIEVLRGAGSVLYGSDAIGGVVHVRTRAVEPGPARARLHGRAATADRSGSGRSEVNAAAGPVAVRVGAGGSHFGDLRGAGPVDAAARVPIYDGDRQRFTGYDEVAGDARATWALGPRRRLTAAAFACRQYGAPRTDKCSPDACLVFDEQLYDLTYLRYRGDHGRVHDLDLGVALSRVREQRSQRDGAAGVTERVTDRVTGRERDQLWSVSAHARAALRPWRLGRAMFHLAAGVDGHGERLGSAATAIMDGARVPRVRGKFLDGSSHGALAAFGLGELRLGRMLGMSAGLRLSATRSYVAPDPETGAAGFATWQALPVASAGAHLRLAGPVRVMVNVDQGFRAPNLYDLTARSGDSGPGYQLPNPALAAESSLTIEGGVKVEAERVQATGFVYRTHIRDFIARRATTCPAALAGQCGSAGAVFQAVNADAAVVRGVEAAARVRVGAGVVLEGTATWTRGDSLPAGIEGMGEPLPKIPPVHGVAVLRKHGRRYVAELALRWAAAQRRLAPRDMADRRIPAGGTPGHAVVDARVGGELGNGVRATLALENLLDSPYRVHGSGVDGAGLGAVLSIAGELR